jgi:uncharacterized delta-60 repeat protein
MSKNFLISALVILFYSLPSHGQFGVLDGDFDGDGIVITSVGDKTDRGVSVAVQNDGKIVVAGYTYGTSDYDVVVLRYNVDGTLDNSFSFDGKVTLDIGYNEYTKSMTIQDDGKIIVVGYTSNGNDNDYFVARFNVDGTLDNTFDSDGKLLTNFGNSDVASDVIVQDDGKIIVMGYSSDINNNFSMAKYNANGSLDNSFSVDGKVTADFGGDRYRSYFNNSTRWQNYSHRIYNCKRQYRYCCT